METKTDNGAGTSKLSLKIPQHESLGLAVFNCGREECRPGTVGGLPCGITTFSIMYWKDAVLFLTGTIHIPCQRGRFSHLPVANGQLPGG